MDAADSLVSCRQASKLFSSCNLKVFSERQLWTLLQLNWRKNPPIWGHHLLQSAFSSFNPPIQDLSSGPEDFVPEVEWSFGVDVEDLVGGEEEKNEMGVLAMLSEGVSGT